MTTNLLMVMILSRLLKDFKLLENMGDSRTATAKKGEYHHLKFEYDSSWFAFIYICKMKRKNIEPMLKFCNKMPFYTFYYKCAHQLFNSQIFYRYLLIFC